jgi:hypothetical protein
VCVILKALAILFEAKRLAALASKLVNAGGVVGVVRRWTGKKRTAVRIVVVVVRGWWWWWWW